MPRFGIMTLCSLIKDVYRRFRHPVKPRCNFTRYMATQAKCQRFSVLLVSVKKMAK